MTMKLRTRTGRLAAVAVVAILMASATTIAQATPLVDQAFTEAPGVFGQPIGTTLDACPYIAQTFTAGVTGTLAGVNVEVHSIDGAPPLRVAIRSTLYGRPYGDPLGYRYLWDPDAPLSRLITFARRIPVVAGQRYAIVVSYKGAKGADPDHWYGVWNGGFGPDESVYDHVSGYDYYPGGRWWAGGCANRNPGFWSTNTWWNRYLDLHFRTYVEPSV
jgi:hypothetical protein